MVVEKDLTHLRNSYKKYFLEEKNVPSHPLLLFNEWFELAQKNKRIKEPNAMSLSTLGGDGFPKVRIVLLKQITEKGFIFYTNYLSEKGRSISKNPKVCVCFFWETLERQVIIKGMAEKVRDGISDSYFSSRPRGSQLSAMVSSQSTIIVDRKILEEKIAVLEKKYKNKPIPRPKDWGGFLVRPYSYEFWQGRADRLHDRILFQKEKEKWQKKRLAP